MTLLMMLSLCLTVGKPPAKKPSTLTSVIHNVTKTATTSSASDGGTSEIVNGLDLSKLPFTPDSIKQVVLSYQPQVQGCHEEAMAAAKPIAGMVKVAFTISAEGLVKSAKVDSRGSSIKDARLGDCLVAVVSSMSFPKPPDGKDHPVEFPFNLKPVE
jgi:TonB family protein